MVRISIHHAHDPSAAERLSVNLLLQKIDVTVVDGPVGAAPDSDAWIVFAADVPWHLRSSSEMASRLIVLQSTGEGTTTLESLHAAVFKYEDISATSLAVRLARHLRAMLPSVRYLEPGTGEFPLNETLGHGAFRIERHLQGEGYQRLYSGRDTQTQDEVFIAFDKLANVDFREFERTLAYSSPGILPLAFVGKLDFTPHSDLSLQTDRWALVERSASGEWLPLLIGRIEPAMFQEDEPRQLATHNPATAVADAVSLGRSAGQILATAAAAGILLTRIRPEFMWGLRTGSGLEVTGLSTRADAFFRLTKIDSYSPPTFDRYYHAVEFLDEDRDDRALVFSLAIMIAEWATGRFPYAHKYHNAGPWTGEHVPLALPRQLATLLSRGMRIRRSARPHLRGFLAELAAIDRELHGR